MKTYTSPVKNVQFRTASVQIQYAINLHFFEIFLKSILILGIVLFMSTKLYSQTSTAPTVGDGSESNPYRISSLNNLYWIAASSTRWAYHYKQTANISASTTSTWFWTPLGYYQGWVPIGNTTTQFTGTYDGDNYTISGLNSNRPLEDNVGLFGRISGGTVKNLKLETATITGGSYTGAVSGYTSGATINKCGVSGSITGVSYVGGMIGYTSGSTLVSECFTSTSTITSGSDNVGGLIGYKQGTVENCFSRSSVARISGATGTKIGSFIGYHVNGATNYSYSTGPVTYTGGTYPTTKGFIGSSSSGTYTSNFFDSETTAQGSSTGATAKTTAQMTSYYTFAFATYPYDFTGESTNGSNDYWGFNTSSNNSYPFLVWQGYTNAAPPYVTTQATSSIAETTATGNGTIVSGTHTITQHGHCWSTTANPTTANNKTTKGTGSTGSFTSSITGLTGSTTYYIRAYATTGVGTFYGDERTFTTTAPKLNQTITFGTLATKTYGDASFTLSATASSGLTVTYTSSNTGVATVSGNTVTITGSGDVTITANQAGNTSYNPAPAVPQTLSVGKKNLTVSGASASPKTYDGSTDAVITGGTLVGKVGSDDVSIATPKTGTFDNRNVGTGKSVTASLTLTGTRATHYTLSQPTGLTAGIFAKELTVTSASVTEKEYDGNTNAAISGATLSGLISGDVVTLGDKTTGTFNNKNVGTGKNVTTAMTITGTHAPNYTLAQPTISGNITAKGLTVTGAAAQNKVYDGTTTATVSGATISGVISGDVVSIANATAGTFANKKVANGVSVSTAMTLTGTDAGNYTLTQPSGLSANITHKELTITGASVDRKVYDGTTDATISGATLSGVVSGDDVVLGDETTGVFDSPSVATRIPVTTAMTLSGKAAVNYTLTQPTRLKGDITAKELTITGALAADKVYDGGTTATVSGATLSGVISGDDCTLGGGTRGTFSQSTVGTSISVSTVMTLRGEEAGNYILTQPTGLRANITTKSLTVTANNITKTFGTTYTFTGTEFTTNGLVGSDAVTSALFSSSGADASAAAGTYPIVVGSATGSGLTNYTIGYTGGTMTVEERTELTLSGLTADAKTYDGTTIATISNYGTLEGVEPGHTVSLVTTSAIATFANKNYGDVTVTVTGLSLTGTDADKYFIGDQTTTAIIHKRPLTLSNFRANDKIYNGYTGATGYFDDNRLEGDDITFSYSCYFSSKTVGENKTVNFTSITVVGGTDRNNYYVPTNSGTATANITVKDVEVINAVASDKVYNGNDIATITGATLSGAVSGDAVSLSNHTAGTFDSKNIGENKPVTINMALTGTDASNYVLIQPSNLEADITAKELTVTGATAQSKNYDGNTDASITGATLVGKITGEDVQLENQSFGTFDNKNIGGSKPVSTSMTISGADIANYTFTPPIGLTASINTKTLTVSGTVAINKVYDGFTSGNLTGATLEGVIGTEDVSLSRETECHFTQATVGENIPVTTDAMTIIGSDIANYLLQRPTGLTANITPKELTVAGANAQDKEYDGNTNATITGATLSGKVNSSDDVTLNNHTTGSFEHKNVGTNIQVATSMTITGVDVGNYTLTQPAGLSADITTKGLTVTGASANDKEYDRTNNATISGAGLSGKVGGDDVVLVNRNNGTFDQSSIGENIGVTSLMSIAGTDAGNYSFELPTGLYADITPKELAITANDIEKNEGESYTFAGTEFSSTGLISGDEITSATLNSAGVDASATVGDYPITIGSAIGSGLTNYVITYIEGTFTVNSVSAVPENYDLPNETLGNGAIECYNAQSNITVAGNGTVELQTGSTAEFIAGVSIRFLPGFHAQLGSSVNAHITTIGDFCKTTSGSMVEAVADKAGSIDQIEPDSKEFQPSQLKEKIMKVYPNPNNGQFNLALSGFENKTDITVFSIQGKVVFRKTQIDSDFMVITLPAVRAGIYSIQINDGKTVKSVKMIVQ